MKTINGYEYGHDVIVHANVYDVEHYYYTIRRLGIIGEILCKKSCSESDVKMALKKDLNMRIKIINDALNQIP